LRRYSKLFNEDRRNFAKKILMDVDMERRSRGVVDSWYGRMGRFTAALASNSIPVRQKCGLGGDSSLAW